MSAQTQSESTRLLSKHDFEAVVELDRRTSGRARRGYMERRLEAALRHPQRHVQLAADREGMLAGFLLARIVEGEYGRRHPAVLLETIGVDPDHQGCGIGRGLLERLETLMEKEGILELMTQARWTNRPLLRFLAGSGFTLAPRQILECPVEQTETFDREEAGRPDLEPLEQPEVPGAEPSGAIVVRALLPADAVAIARIDRRVMGEDRSAYLGAKLDEALEESAVRVSLIAEAEGMVAGFVMARVDFGDFGQVEPTAALDTIGVAPELGRRGIGRELMRQLLLHLRALRVERVETQVERERFELLAFLYRCGFAPSATLAFSHSF
jgi:predicted N-acetyltransferase YhbS